MIKNLPVGHRALGFAIALTLGACGAGTATQGPDAKLPSAGPDGEYSLDWPDLGRGEARYIKIDLGDSYLTCRQVSPKFPFDSALTRAQDRAQLKAFASCMNHESMAGRTVVLVGRADERGSAAYNEELGLKRATRIKDLLVLDGLAATRIEVETKGESNAVGAQPQYSHGYDRRVDVIVRGGAHGPGGAKP